MAYTYYPRAYHEHYKRNKERHLASAKKWWAKFTPEERRAKWREYRHRSYHRLVSERAQQRDLNRRLWDDPYPNWWEKDEGIKYEKRK